MTNTEYFEFGSFRPNRSETQIKKSVDIECVSSLLL